MSSSTILFLHGASLGGWMWQEVISYLPDDYHCLTPDYEKIVSPFTLDKGAKYLAELIADSAPVHVVGISLGGLVGLELLRQYPDLIGSAFLSSTSMGPVPGGAILSALSVPLAWISSRPFIARQSATQFGLPEKMIEPFVNNMRAMTSTNFRQTNELIRHYYPENISYPVNKPVMLIYGEKEADFVKKNQHRLQQALNIERVYLVPDGGHGWCFENPELFAGTVQAWVTDNNLPSELRVLQ